MEISVFTVLITLLWFSIFILIASALRKKTGFLIQYHITPILVLISLCVLRILLPVEFPFTFEIRIHKVFPDIQIFLTTPRYAGFSLWQLLLVALALVAVIRLAQLFVNILRDKKLARKLSSRQYPRAEILLDKIVGQTKSRAKYRLLVSEEVNSPIIFGFFVPTIFLPFLVEQYSDEDLSNILLHEWYHHVNRDIWIKLFFEILCCIMWWNPCVYILKRDLDQTLELKCDLKVTRNMQEVEKKKYLDSMLRVLEFGRNNSVRPKSKTLIASNFVADTNEEILQRFKFILGYKSRVRAGNIGLFISMLAVMMILSYTIVIQPFSEPPSQDIEDTYVITPENAYLKPNDDGTYSLYLNDEFFYIVEKEMLESIPIKNLEIIE